MAGNESLNSAARDKNDEFYTQLTDIEKELRYYRKHFKGKTVFCNCDDPFESNFFKYFVLNFNRLGLKKLIATCYATSPIAHQQLSLFDVLGGDESNKGKPYKAVVTKIYDATGDGGIDMLDVAELFKMGENELTELKGDGDFRSDECLELLKEADIVVTNPPFSLFREYVATLIDYKKDFLIIGNRNAITYKEIFPLLKENRMWLGNGFSNGNAFFKVLGDASNYAKGVYDENTGLVKFRNCAWFTNLDIKKRHEDLILVNKYSPEIYPNYDNYNAINVDKVKDIPYNYEGVMGVPITFLDKYNPSQFEVVGIASRHSWSNYKDDLTKLGFNPEIDSGGGLGAGVVNGTTKYARILIRNKHPEPRSED